LKPSQLQKVTEDLEDAISFSGLLVSVESDTDQGVIIGVGGLESPLQ
jgi:hypothetical protein